MKASLLQRCPDVDGLLLLVLPVLLSWTIQVASVVTARRGISLIFAGFRGESRIIFFVNDDLQSCKMAFDFIGIFIRIGEGRWGSCRASERTQASQRVMKGRTPLFCNTRSTKK